MKSAADLFQLDARAKEKRDLLSTVYRTLDDAVVNSPKYALYVAPVPLAYMVSHPHFNIYKGDWAKLRFLGFGLDAIPHSTTAFGLTNLVIDTLAVFRHHTPHNAAWHPLAVHADRHSRLIAGAFLVGASALYESGEYEIHIEELRETHGDESKINMEWSVQDTLFDLISNALGWLAGVILRRQKDSLKRMQRAQKI